MTDHAARAVAAKRAAEESREAHIRAQTVYEQCLQRLKTEYGCKSLKEATQLHAKLERELEAAAQTCEDAWAAFEAQRQGL